MTCLFVINLGKKHELFGRLCWERQGLIQIALAGFLELDGRRSSLSKRRLQ